MHFTYAIALALGLAPVWAVPVEPPTLDISPALLTPNKLQLDLPGLALLKPKIPNLVGRFDFALKKSIALNWNDGAASS